MGMLLQLLLSAVFRSVFPGLVTPPWDDLLTEAEVSELLGRTLRCIREWHRRRIGPPRITFQRTILYRRSSLMRWLERFESKPNDSKVNP